YLARGRVKSASGNPYGAIDDFSEAILRDPWDGKAYYERGCARGDRREWKLSLSDLRTAMEKRPALAGDSMIRIYLARSRIGEGKDASEELKSLIPDSARILGDWTRTRCMFATHQISEEEFFRALDSLPGAPVPQRSSEAYYLIAYLRLLAGDNAG